MGVFRFLYDVFIYLTSNYSKLPEDFQRRFPEHYLVNARIFLHDCVSSGQSISKDFDDYE